MEVINQLRKVKNENQGRIQNNNLKDEAEVYTSRSNKLIQMTIFVTNVITEIISTFMGAFNA